MTTLLVCIGIFVWIYLILLGIFKNDEEVQKELPKEVLKKAEEKESEVFLEPISDEQLNDMFGSVRRNNDQFVSLSGVRKYFPMFSNEGISFKIYEALSPLPHFNTESLLWLYNDKKLDKRLVSDTYVTLQITYFDYKFQFSTQRIQLKRKEVGYTCQLESDNKTLKELKEFFENSFTISENDFKFFTDKAEELGRQERDCKVKQTVEEVFSCHISYNKTAVLYGTEKAVSITSVDTFYNFCNLIGYHIPLKLQAEITNYLYILFGVNNDSESH